MEAWHALRVDEVFRKVGSSSQGLSTEEAARRLEKYGYNELRKEEGKSPLSIFIDQFKNILILILLAATALSIAIGELIDAVTIIAIVIASAFLGFYQEYRAEKAIEALKKLAAPTARVLRDGRVVTVLAREIVPGDVILLTAGDKVPADARLFEVVNLRVDESSLTGESVVVSKTTDPLSPETPLPDRKNMVYAGTVVTYGKAKAVVVATGMETELGRIAAAVQEVEEEKTPLEKRMEVIGRWLAILCLGVAVFVSLLGLLIWKYDILTMVMWAVSLAVAAVPEALPAVVTGALAIGMYRMAKCNAIIRKLPAVETLGCTTFICSDKTGTMTKGEMTVRKIYLPRYVIEVTGSGYDPKGEFVLDGKAIYPLSIHGLKLMLLACALNNDAELEKLNGQWVVKGDPTEAALLVLARKAGLKAEVNREYPRISEIPFSSERKRMTTYHKTPEGRVVAFIKGAPEVVLSLSDRILIDGEVKELTERDREEIIKRVETFASQGLRNLAFAYKEVKEEEARQADEKNERGFIFLGFVGMMDPPRPEVKEALDICREAGIKVSMITGDHKLTAIAIAKELGMYDGDKALTGKDLDSLTDEELEKMVEDVKVYARVSPEHKLKIIRALKKRGHVVAMTGDGVNDAPALKAADIGVAMGITGTEVAKEAADMVLADDNFATIVEAVKQGREIYEDIRKYLAYLLRCNIAEILVPLVAALAGLPLPFTAVQYLWINLVTDGLPALALGVDPVEREIMKSPPRKTDEPVFNSREVALFLILTPLILTALLVGIFSYQIGSGLSLAEARTTAFTAMVVSELFLALSCRSLRKTVWGEAMFRNKFLIGALIVSLAMQVFVLYVPALQVAFDIVAPTSYDWMLAAFVAVLVFTSVETFKKVLFR